ncbi:MAG: hypothetical protein AAF968_27485, partial [Pseudomonadota bacterium]
MYKTVKLFAEHRLAIIRVDGQLTLEAFLYWIEHEPDARLFYGNDRIVILEPTARAGGLTPAKLQLMQGRVLVEEHLRAAIPAWRTVVVTSDSSLVGVAELYCALWNRLATDQIHFDMAGSLPAALTMLGKPIDLDG